MIESLERRQLLTSISVSNHVLTVNGDRADNLINVVENNHAVHVETSGSNGVITAKDYTGITKIKINGGGGDDAINYDGNTIGANIHGDDDGHDSSGGSKLANLLSFFFGGGSHNGWCGRSGGTNWWSWSWKKTGGKHGDDAGNDNISVTDEGTGHSIIDGDDGDDSLTVVVGNHTTVYGGDGNDQVFLNTGVGVYDTLNASTVVFTEAGKDTVTAYDGSNTVHGGNGKDTFIDLGGNNVIDGFEVVVS